MTPEARDGLDHLCDLYRHYPDIRRIADTLRIELGRNEEWRDKYCERNAKLLADNQKFISQIEKLEAEIEKVRESIGIVQAENVRLRDLLAEVIACDETNGWTPFVLDQNNLLDTTRRNVTVPTKLIERAKELQLRAAG